jgi:hypothetical protein
MYTHIIIRQIKSRRETMKGNCSGAGGYVKGSLFKIREI